VTEKQTKIIDAQNAQTLKTVQPDPMAIIAEAVRAGKGVEDLQVLYNLQKDWENRKAREEFAEALSSFQSECPPIPKNASSKQATGGGSGYAYRYATLDAIERIVKPLLAARGLSYTFDSELMEGMVKVTATLRGKGHEISASFTSPIDKGGRMNLIQQHATSLAYAKRYALSQVLGISTTDDNDGLPLAPNIPLQSISDEQLAEIEDMIEASGADKPKLLKFFKVEKLGDLPEQDYGRVIAMLKAKLK
jgi:hypothetical protein